MRNTTYKYNVGDYVKFKEKFPSPTCGLVGREGTIAKITGLAPSYNNKPHYYLDNNICGAYRESCFAGLASEASKNFPCRDEVLGADTLQGPETKCDTEDSGKSENNAEWLTINHSIPVYACSSCHAPALCDPRGWAVDSKFCPHCGKFMINYTPEDDDYEM